MKQETEFQAWLLLLIEMPKKIQSNELMEEDAREKTTVDRSIEEFREPRNLEKMRRSPFEEHSVKKLILSFRDEVESTMKKRKTALRDA